MPRPNSRWLLLLCCLLASLAAHAEPQAAKPDKAAIAQALQWREDLLQAGGAGLYQALDLEHLAKRAHLNAIDRRLLPRLVGLFAQEKPARVRVYWVATRAQWLARLDFEEGGTGFLALVEEGGKLIDWQDYSLGTSLSQLLAAAAASESSTLETFLATLDDDPMQALTLVDAHSPLARLVAAACLSHDCYEEALAKLPLATGEVSILALEKAIAAGNFTAADTQMDKLQQALGDDPAVVWLAAGLSMSEKRWQQALDQVNPALARWPSEPRLYPLASQCYMELHQPQQALAILNAMVQKTGTPIDWQALTEVPLYAPLKPLLKADGLL